MILTLNFALHHNSANSQAIGCSATQQNAAYNAAFDINNRESNLPKSSNRNTSDAINKWTTAWRQASRHQEGGEQACEAYQRPQQSRSERSERVVRAIANGEEYKQGDVRPHSRTLAHRTRKHGGMHRCPKGHHSHRCSLPHASGPVRTSVQMDFANL